MALTQSATVGFALTLIISHSAIAQHNQHPPSAASSYANMEIRKVKALSAEQIADLEAGRGMGLALAAELNGYPGPVHVIEHASALKLTADQERRSRALFDAMKAETIPIGQRLIAEEARLDRAFADRTITADTLKDATAAIGATQAALRAAHLRFHLAQVEVLTARAFASLGRRSRETGLRHRSHDAYRRGRQEQRRRRLAAIRIVLRRCR